jgi:hypothetical protein
MDDYHLIIKILVLQFTFFFVLLNRYADGHAVGVYLPGAISCIDVWQAVSTA